MKQTLQIGERRCLLYTEGGQQPQVLLIQTLGAQGQPYFAHGGQCRLPSGVKQAWLFQLLTNRTDTRDITT